MHATYGTSGRVCDAESEWVNRAEGGRVFLIFLILLQAGSRTAAGRQVIEAAIVNLKDNIQVLISTYYA